MISDKKIEYPVSSGGVVYRHSKGSIEIVLCGRPVQDTSKTTYDAIIPQICFRYDDDA